MGRGANGVYENDPADTRFSSAQGKRRNSPRSMAGDDREGGQGGMKYDEGEKVGSI